MRKALALLVLVLFVALPLTAARNFTQTDSGQSCSASDAIACSDLSVADDEALGRLADEGGTAGTTQVTWTYANGDANSVCFWVTSDEIGQDTSWPSGTWTVRLNVTTADTQSIINAKICRVTTTCATVLGVVGNDSTVTSLSTTGTKTWSISGASQSANTTDKFVVVFDCQEDQAHGNSTVGVTPDQNIDTPLTAPAPTRSRAVMVQ